MFVPPHRSPNLPEAISQYCTRTLTLATNPGRWPHSRSAKILECHPQQLPCHRRAFDIPIRSHRLRNLISLLWVDDAIWVLLRSQVAFQPKDDQGEVIYALKRSLDLVDPLRRVTVISSDQVRFGCLGLSHISLHIDETQSLADVVTYYDGIRL